MKRLKNKMTQLTVEEQQGIKAVQYLQSVREIDESEEDALIGWRKMSSEQQKFTLDFANNLMERETPEFWEKIKGD